MSTRTPLAVGLVGALVAAGALAPAALGATKPKPKPITRTYEATATPDPTSTNPVTNEICAPTTPTAKHVYAFTVPAKGVLSVTLGNQLDWSVAIRDSYGDTLATADGGTPTDKETTASSFKRKEKITIETCNFAGEPTIPVSFTFTYK